jgi:hypothetical protein
MMVSGTRSWCASRRAGRCRSSRRTRVAWTSDLDYTIPRPVWFTNDDEVNYETTRKGTPFRGHDVSRQSLASLVVKMAITPGFEIRQSLGANKPVR